MGHQRKNESQRLAQHILAKEIVELAHGADAAKNAEAAHKEAFSHGTNTFSLSALRNSMGRIEASASSETAEAPKPAKLSTKRKALLEHKMSFISSDTTQVLFGTTREQSQSAGQDMITLPLTMLQPGSFPLVLRAAGLASSKSDAHRLIASKGAYVVVPNSGSPDTPTALQWISIEASASADPSHFLVDWEALVLRSGKSKIKICRVVSEEQFEAEGLTCPGWEELKAKKGETKKSEGSA